MSGPHTVVPAGGASGVYGPIVCNEMDKIAFCLTGTTGGLSNGDTATLYYAGSSSDPATDGVPVYYDSSGGGLIPVVIGKATIRSIVLEGGFAYWLVFEQSSTFAGVEYHSKPRAGF